MSFYLIQRGTFNGLKGEYDGLTGRNGLINLDYMGASEFEWGTLPASYRYIMKNKGNYIYHYCNSIKDYRGKILVIYCHRDYADDIEKEMKNYIDKRYHLKCYSTIHSHISGDDEYGIRKDFFWNLDDDADGQWMAWFGMDKLTPFKTNIDKDYEEWYLKLPEDKR